ncbi:MAG: hypothetical protein A2008_03160 [Candidatus Wallbacteria bacterium GWC2_49_35]|uniref:Uncharacterized protein n=1 Tax=Candidatus Wallbacteria bacterium GWC2_49_35 TaxID=1817813 RepID=A0A1F7WI61_9BACT|nr:MAG: hypothetical protein A2008_03160 [Candidatus Wallbacteria bacterium GWC2_49_35]HBC75704.1 deoxyuridine 5'-triphosphate nucleotidohydrolase [Candidatus Wallbacteria bacterium]
MHFLSSNEFSDYLCRERPLVEFMANPGEQVQPNGIELTLREISKLTSAGRIAVSNKERAVSKTEPVAFDEKGGAFLEKGCYMVMFNEITNIDPDMFAFARVRSSLLRSGATIQTALWDSGYSGRPSALLVVYNENGIYLEKNARVIQLIFYKFDAPVEKTYSGAYQKENVHKS